MGPASTVERPALVRAAVLSDLAAVGRDSTFLGSLALGLAEQIDNAADVMGVAALVKQLRATMSAALLAALPVVDPLDELRARRSDILRHKGPRP